MQDAHLTLTREEEYRSLAEAVFNHLGGAVHYADLIIEEIAKVEYNRLVGGEEILKPFTSRSAMQIRLTQQDGRNLNLSTGVLPFEELRDSLDRAVQLLESQEPVERFGLAPVPNPDRVRYGLPVTGPETAEAVAERFESLAREVVALEEAALAGHPGLRLDTEIWCYSEVEQKLIADSEGLYKTQILPSSFLQVMAKCRDTATGRLTQQRTRLGDIRPLSFFFGPDGALRPDFRERLGECFRRAVALQSGRRLTREELGRLTHYVLAPSAMVFVHEAEGHNFEADIIRDGGSGLFNREGTPVVQQLGSPVVDVYDGPVLRRDGTFARDEGFGTEFIDDEGVELQPVALVCGGAIAGKLHNRETAYYFGEEPNGHGFSELGDPRLVRMTNTYLAPHAGAPWKDSLEELIKGIPFGVYLEGSMGGAVSKEGMSTTIQFGRLIVDGILTDQVLLPANLSVRTLGSLEGIEAFAGPLRCEDPGFCGKGQTKVVTDGGPITRIRASDSITLGF